ncbi:MAG: YigZ family protein [Desulfobacteraceae bacterium]|nr:MAG: YigZ family protein [Desulfobacteraceae bacterium]
MDPASDEYLTLARDGRAELRVQASRFFAFARRVEGEAEAAAQRAALKREYHDASHQPFAYRLADGAERSSDDGEPKGTSGPPILAQIRSVGLVNVQVVVVRYFGGTKLGKGGLVRAFGEAARLALEDSGRRTQTRQGYLDVVAAPEIINTVRAVAGRFGAAVVTLSFGASARMRLALPASRLDECRDALVQRFGSAILEVRT